MCDERLWWPSLGKTVCYSKSDNRDSVPSVTDGEEIGDCMRRVGVTGNGQIGSWCDRRWCEGDRCDKNVHARGLGMTGRADQGDLVWPESTMMEVGLMVTAPSFLAFQVVPLKTLD